MAASRVLIPRGDSGAEQRYPMKGKVPGPHVHFLTIQQASLVAGLERRTIKRLVDEGRLPSCYIPGDIKRWRRVSRSDVLALRREMEGQLHG